MKPHYLLCALTILSIVTCIEGCSKSKKKCCTGGQKWVPCMGCNITCDPRPVACPTVCIPGCKCPANKPIWHQGRCIRRIECPVCEGGRIYQYCTSGCDRSCENPDLICTGYCIPRCACPGDKPFFHNGECIAQDYCCPGGQVYIQCGSECTKTCSNPNPICSLQCVSRCECPPDKPIWMSNQCVDASECPVCTGGREWNDCSSGCSMDCGDATPTCPDVEFSGCMGRCDCPAGKPFTHMGNCIAEEECPD